MIFNENVGWHAMYQGRRRRLRASTAARKPAASSASIGGVVRPDANGTLAEKCAWMRLRQAEARGRNRA